MRFSKQQPAKRWRKLGRKARTRAFTLIEIMIVMAIIMIIMATGIPSIVRSLERDELSRAVKDTIEGCKTARDRAIFQGIPWAFVVTVDQQMERHLKVEPMPGDSAQRTRSGEVGPGLSAASNDSPYSGFPRKLGNNVYVDKIAVNFKEPDQEADVRVRFFPNGTADEFTVVYSIGQKQRFLKVDVVTGLATEYTP
jgi:prepilin-type N-terminal cleavage/methylation domain-containing protein